MTFHRLRTFLTLKRCMTPSVFGVILGALALSGCAVVPQGARPTPPSKPQPSTPRPALPVPAPAPAPTPSPRPTGPSPAIAAGVIPGPALGTLLPQGDGRAILALRAFKASCA